MCGPCRVSSAGSDLRWEARALLGWTGGFEAPCIPDSPSELITSVSFFSLEVGRKSLFKSVVKLV